MAARPVGGDQVHEAEAAGVGIGTTRPILGLEDDVGVLVVLGRPGLIELARPHGRPGVAISKRPVMPRCITRVSPRSSGASRYLARRSSRRILAPVRRWTKPSGSGKRRSGRPRLDAGQARALQDGGQAAPDGLDFGQFGQGSSFEG
jgi:hypothetical protein